MAMDSTEQELVEHVRRLRERQLAWTRELVAIPTVNPYSGDSSAGSEAAGQAWIEHRLRALGAAVRRVPVPADVYERGGVLGPADRRWDGRENVVGEWVFGDGSGPVLILNDHMDTVGTDGMEFSPFDPVVRDGRLFGRGSSDTKGNLVMGLTAVEALLAHARGLSGRLLFESVVDEECNGGGAGTLACCLAGLRGDGAICLDGGRDRLVTGCNGLATARMLVRGQSGHSSAGTTVSAIDKAIVVKQSLDRFEREHRARHPLCRATLGVFRSGTLPAIVPGLAELQLNVTYPASEAAEAERRWGRWGGRAFRERFEALLAGLAAEDEWFGRKPVEVSWIKEIYPYETDPSHPLVRIAAAAVEDATSERPAVGPMPAWFDGAHLARQLGIPVVSMGRGTPGAAHSAGESVVVEDLLTGAESLALALARLLREGADWRAAGGPAAPRSGEGRRA